MSQHQISEAERAQLRDFTRQKARLYTLVVLDKTLSDTARRLAWLLLDCTRLIPGSCHPALGTLAEVLGTNRRTVQRAIGELERYFDIERHRGGRRQGGHAATHVYTPKLHLGLQLPDSVVTAAPAPPLKGPNLASPPAPTVVSSDNKVAPHPSPALPTAVSDDTEGRQRRCPATANGGAQTTPNSIGTLGKNPLPRARGRDTGCVAKAADVEAPAAGDGLQGEPAAAMPPHRRWWQRWRR